MQSPKILIVDDESCHQVAIMDCIEECGKDYDLLSAFSAKEALDIVGKECPDLIISDWEMPEMDGIAFIERLKAMPLFSDIPVIMCTGIMTSSDHLQIALEAGAVDYIRKPIDKVELMARINASLLLAHKYKQLQELNATKDRVFSVIAHDLRGPVGALKSLSDVLVDNLHALSPDKIAQSLAVFNQQSSSAYAVLDNLLIWARSQQGVIDYKPKSQAMAAAIEPAIALLQNMAQEKDIDLISEVSPDLIAYFDIDLIAIVIRNLVNNAIKFTRPGGIIRLTSEVHEGRCTIAVVDNGVGINANVLKTLFDKTSTSSTFGTNNEKGSGLGLKLCQEFVELHQGRLSVESEAGKGSTFSFTLPR